MNGNSSAFGRRVLAAALLAAGMGQAQAGDDIESLKAQIRALQQQLQAIEKKLAEQDKARSETEAKVDKVAKEAGEWKQADSVVHLAGYGSIGYTDNENAKGRFNQVQFSPIFHYQYKDLMMLESELEITNTADGETNTELEYLTLDLFVNDTMALVAGKFLSPIGQFRQNFHPSWINKLPSAPPGFGHDGAAPVSETGLQVRGGFPLSGMRANYALYVSNGPELNAVDEDGDGVADALEGIVAEGRTSDKDGNKVWGGRFGLLPMQGLEVGLSFATGKAAVTSLIDDTTGNSSEISGASARNYDVIGADLTWHWNLLDVRSEYVRTKIGADASGGSTATAGAEWKTWYAQAAYKFAPTKFEAVVRYTDFDSPHAAEDQKQWALGLNYLFASNVIGKIAYEFNDGQAGQPSDDNGFMLQMAYGF